MPSENKNMALPAASKVGSAESGVALGDFVGLILSLGVLTGDA